MNGTERREQCRAAIRALHQAVETVGHTRYLRNSQADFHQHVSATLLAAAQEWFRLPCPCYEYPAIAKRFQKLVVGDGPKLAM
jgi:hypothetical protein